MRIRDTVVCGIAAIDLRGIQSEEERDARVLRRFQELTHSDRARFRKAADALHVKQLGEQGLAELVHQLQVVLGCAEELSRRRED